MSIKLYFRNSRNIKLILHLEKFNLLQYSTFYSNYTVWAEYGFQKMFANGFIKNQCWFNLSRISLQLCGYKGYIVNYFILLAYDKIYHVERNLFA